MPTGGAATGNEGHAPSAYRRIARDCRAGADPVSLAGDARRIPEPSFAARALVAVATGPRTPDGLRDTCMTEALRYIGTIPREWRRAEVLVESLADLARSSGPGHARHVDAIMEHILRLPEGEALSQAIQAAAPLCPPTLHERLLCRAVGNRGFERDDAKTVLRIWVEAGTPLAPGAEALRQVGDPDLRARLLVYVHALLVRTGAAGPEWLTAALDAAARVEEPVTRRETMRVVLGDLERPDDLAQVATTVDREPDDATAAHVLATLGGRADRAGDRHRSLQWFEAGAARAAAVADAGERAKAERKLAEGLERAGATAEATRLRARTPAARASVPAAAGTARGARAETVAAPSVAIRDTLGLYDTYEGGLKTTHFRAIARAAPLCLAFDLDLALFGFPTSDLSDLVARTIRDTTISGGGRPVGRLFEEGRIHLVPCSARDPPTDWSAVGYPVASTESPLPERAMTLEQARKRAAAGSAGRVCLVMGLGNRGLPRSLLDAVDAHYEITGARIGLETATAMGILADRLGRRA